ncbi:MAG: prepilin peptidase [Bythopirellula sp.]
MPATALIDFVTALWLAFLGACIGSFLNVVAYRLPLGMSVIWKPSHCPKCNHPIRAYDNVPVLGWLWLRGKCRDCGEPISPRYAIVEFVMGAAFFVLAYVELFSGGANLPNGPITEFTGALQNVWNPQWKLIRIYAFHGLLFSWIVSLALIVIDGQRVPKRLAMFGLLVFFCGMMFGGSPVETVGALGIMVAALLQNSRTERV